MATRTLTRTIALVAALTCATSGARAGRSRHPAAHGAAHRHDPVRHVGLDEQHRPARPSTSPTAAPGQPVELVQYADERHRHSGAPRGPRRQRARHRNQLATPTGGGALGGGNENYQRTCQIFNEPEHGRRGCALLCARRQRACQDDDANGELAAGRRLGPANSLLEHAGRRRRASAPRCVPDCASTPASAATNGGICTTVNRNRMRGTTAGSTTSFTQQALHHDHPARRLVREHDRLPASNYLWWMLNEIYLGTRLSRVHRRRTACSRRSRRSRRSINQMNVDGQDPKVKFGLARYDGAASNGGYVVVPASLEQQGDAARGDQRRERRRLPGVRERLDAALRDAGRRRRAISRVEQPLRHATRSTTEPHGWNRRRCPPSPITSQCEKIFIIVVTDGLPTADDNNHYGTATSRRTMAGYIDADPNIPVDGDGDFADDVAAKLFDTDLRPTRRGRPERHHLHGRLLARLAAARSTPRRAATASTTRRTTRPSSASR